MNRELLYQLQQELELARVDYVEAERNMLERKKVFDSLASAVKLYSEALEMLGIRLHGEVEQVQNVAQPEEALPTGRSEQITWAISKRGYGMKAQELAAFLYKRGAFGSDNFKLAATKVHRSIYQMCQAGKLREYPRSDKGKRNNFYGIPAFFDGDAVRPENALPEAT